MDNSFPPERDNFSNRFGVIAAAAGSAIGLGNIWRFPYITGENGGGAFLMVYLFFILVIGIPVMTSEFIIGRAAQKNPYRAFRILAPGKPWYLIGLMGVAAAFMILAFYTAVAGWTLEYFYQSVMGNLADKTELELKSMFDNFVAGSYRPVLWFLVFMGLTAFIVIAGVKKGIEKYSKILMPVLVILLLLLCVRSLTLEGSMEGLRFLFRPDLSKINGKVILEALGQAFFSMSIGMGTLITYGSYIRKNENLAKSAFAVGISDTLIAILAGVAIFPAVFALGGSPAEGKSLVFIALPGIFQKMPFGEVFAVFFFLLLTIAALTSTISLLEVIVAYFVEELKISRRKATLAATIAGSFLGIITVFSLSSLGHLTIFNLNIFGLLEFLSTKVILPLGGFLIVLFIGWYFGSLKAKKELSNEGQLKVAYFPVFIFIVKFLAPVAIAFVFLYSLGLINF
jgi:neurotransmitter:Na+ symporter, NSS family